VAPTNDKQYISKADERCASNKGRQKTIVIWNNVVSPSISISPTIAEQAIIDDFYIKVSRGSSESRRRTLLVLIILNIEITAKIIFLSGFSSFHT
jgi:hypothetical protein